MSITEITNKMEKFVNWKKDFCNTDFLSCIEKVKKWINSIKELEVCNDCNPFSHWGELSEEEINEVNALISSMR